MLRPDAACSRDFRKVWSVSQDMPRQVIHMEKASGPTSWGVQGLKESPGQGWTVITRLMETQIWHPPADSVGTGLIKGRMASASTFIWEKAAPQLSSWCQVLQFLLCPWCPPICCPSTEAQKEWVRVSLYATHLRGTAWDSRSPPSHSASIPAVFYSQKLWELLFPTLECWAWEPGVGLGPLTVQGGTYAAKISLWIFILLRWVWD